MRYFYSYGVELLGIMDDVELVLRMLRRNMKRGGGIGGRWRSGMTTEATSVWEMETAWTMENRRRDREKLESGSHCWTSSRIVGNVESVLRRMGQDLKVGGVGWVQRR